MSEKTWAEQMREKAQDLTRNRQAWIEACISMFLKDTGLNINEVALCEEQTETGYRYSVEKKEGIAKSSGPWGSREWVSVDFDLPEPNKPVLVFERIQNEVFCGIYDPDANWRSGTKWSVYLDGAPIEATHWMELPEGPK